MVNKLYNEPLKKYTTMKTGGPAEVFSIPETEDELLSEIRYCRENKINYRILGNGSNVLVRDKGVKGYVIYNKKALSHTRIEGNTVIVGSSVMLQHFVMTCIDNNLEGMEFLYSIPGTVGGSLYMNAGRGQKYNQSISDRVSRIKVFDGAHTFYISKDEANFKYRYSIFHDRSDWTILEVEFVLRDQACEIGKKKIQERMQFVKTHQLRKYPNVGTVYKNGASRKLLKLLSYIKKGDCSFAGNWICNYGNAKTRDILFLLRISRVLHAIILKKPELEVEIW